MTATAKKPHAGDDAARDAHESWRDAYDRQIEPGPALRNRSGVEIKPLYTPDDWDGARYQEDLGFPGGPPGTRGTYTTMYRGRPWSRRQIVGFGLPEDYNRRQRAFIDAGVTGIYLAPCNSYMRGYDIDQVDPAVLGTCGTLINTVDDMDRCLAGIELADAGLSLGDNPPFTLSAMVLAVARQRGTDWSALAGTTNQSDYLSHYVANHMFFRIALPGSRRLLLDHMDFMTRHCPRWNPLSVVGQHMQQAGANPAEAMAFTLASALQYAEDLIAAGHDVDDFLPRFSFFFDISMSFFEEIAKFRAGRRLWMRLARDRLGAKDPKSWRFRFHGQTSGVDLTRQQPLNNIARVAIQAMAGIFGGLQSLHTDSYDEALSSPTEDSARIALATQNILHDEAHLGDVIDPLGGSYFVETLTDEMEGKIEAVLDKIDAAGGMYRAVEDGLVQRMIGDSARAFQERLDRGEETIVGVTAYGLPDDAAERPAPLERLSPEAIEGQLARLKSFKEGRNQTETRRAMDRLARAAGTEDGENIYQCVVEAIAAGATHGEVCARVRDIMGFGQPLIAA